MQSAGATESANDKKTDYLMLGIYGVLSLLVCCGGALVVGLMGAESESGGMNAAMAAAGPGCCACSGFLTALLGMVALKGKKTAKIAAPIVVSLVGGFSGAVGMWVFFEVIFPSL